MIMGAQILNSALVSDVTLWSSTTLPTVGAVTPYLFAAASGALAVTSVLVAIRFRRRVLTDRRTAQLLQSKIDEDMTSERVFHLRRDKLLPASPSAEAYARDIAGAEVAENLNLRILLGDETTRDLAPQIRALLTDGAPFIAHGRDASGDAWRFVGQTSGAKAILRMWPADAAEMRHAKTANAPPTPSPANAETAEGDAMLLARSDAIDVVADNADAQERRGKIEDQAADDIWRAALAEAPLGVVVIDAQQRLQGANAAARRLWRLEPGFVERRPTLRALLDTLRFAGRAPAQPDYSSWCAKLLADPVGAISQEPMWILPDGDGLRVLAAPAADGGVTLFVSDETSALGLGRRYNTALHARRAMIAALKIGLIVIGADRRAQVMNPAFAKLWGLDPALCSEDAAGAASLSEIAHKAGVDEDDQAIWRKLSAAAEQVPGAPRKVERFQAARANGQRLSIQTTPLPDGAILFDFVDVTDAHTAETALRQRAQATEAVEKMKSELLNDVAYQLRTPLNAVIGFADMVRQGMAGPLNARQCGYLDNVLRAANDLRERIQDALDLGALRAGAAQLERRPLDLNRIAQSLSAVITPSAHRLGATVNVEPWDAPVEVLADESRLKHSLIAAASALSVAASAGDQLTFAVRMKNHKPQLMLTLARAAGGALDLEASPEAGGVALSLARRLIELHDGVLTVEPRDDGLRLVATLPPEPREHVEPDAKTSSDARRLMSRAT